ncbi:hypothetical protein E2C01_027952 [Portunus trituberculatus]|uniref:Uncharacterized protein n=1 Tax=Portunus trituberculatus TaxID=210409 RepID=A0A5B7EMK7_PORTR|nr:hypothetical protein [Portunus trituberculatus]
MTIITLERVSPYPFFRLQEILPTPFSTTHLPRRSSCSAPMTLLTTIPHLALCPALMPDRHEKKKAMELLRWVVTRRRPDRHFHKGSLQRHREGIGDMGRGEGRAWVTPLPLHDRLGGTRERTEGSQHGGREKAQRGTEVEVEILAVITQPTTPTPPCRDLA